MSAAERGQSTVEFALVLPLLVLCAVALVQTVRVGVLQVAVVDAARTGARAAAVDPHPDAVRRALVAAGAGPDPVFDVRADPGRPDGTPAVVTVEVSRRVALVPGIGRSSVTLRAAVAMPLEEDPSP